MTAARSTRPETRSTGDMQGSKPLDLRHAVFAFAVVGTAGALVVTYWLAILWWSPIGSYAYEATTYDQLPLNWVGALALLIILMAPPFCVASVPGRHSKTERVRSDSRRAMENAGIGLVCAVIILAALHANAPETVERSTWLTVQETPTNWAARVCGDVEHVLRELGPSGDRDWVVACSDGQVFSTVDAQLEWQPVPLPAPVRPLHPGMNLLGLF